MSDEAGELSGAVMSPAKAFDFAFFVPAGQQAEIFARARQWVGEISEVPWERADALVFTTTGGRVHPGVMKMLLVADANQKHILQYDDVEQIFIRRNREWLTNPRRLL